MTMFHININMNRSISDIIHHRLTVLMLLSFMLLSVGDVQAQSDPGGLDDDPGQSVPLDGGISLLIGAGVYYGARRMDQRNRKRSVQVKARPRP
jgi:hypothetical protein